MFTKQKPKPIKTWRTIRQPTFTRSATLLGWFKQAKKALKLSFYLGLVLGLSWFFLKGKGHLASLKNTLCHTSLAKGKPFTLSLKTDGVLNESHIHATLALPEGLGLLELDLQALKHKLSTLPEVKSVTLEKDLPGKLCIHVLEHHPMARIAFMDSKGKTKAICISEEGIIFQPSHPSKALKDLPWLDGIKLRIKEDGSFEALPQLAFLAPLLEQARLTHPRLYAQFKSIQCQAMDACPAAPWSTVKVKTVSYGEWIFATKDYPSQLERLDTILLELSTRRSKRVKAIDLSLEGQAVVSFY